MASLRLVVVALAVVGSAALAPLLGEIDADTVANTYLVMFKDTAAATARGAHFKAGVVARHEYTLPKLNGYSATLSEDLLQFVLADPAVAYVERDRVVRLPPMTRTFPVGNASYTASGGAVCAVQSGATWGISRVSFAAPSILNDYNYPTTLGAGVDVYVIDTGVFPTHQEFTGRAIFEANYIDTDNRDCNGHGTHVAGTIGGATYGLAKQSIIHGIKVLNCGGSGTTASVVAGVDHSAREGGARRAVLNLSLGGSKSTAMNQAVASAVDAGCHVAVAAGNSNADACNYSPASELKAITVGSTTRDANRADVRSSFSNYGTCVDLFAPGSDITAAWIDTAGYPPNQALATISGTSMASPHVAGVVALGRVEEPTVDSWEAKVKETGPKGLVTLNCGAAPPACAASPNIFLYAYYCEK